MPEYGSEVVGRRLGVELPFYSFLQEEDRLAECEGTVVEFGETVPGKVPIRHLVEFDNGCCDWFDLNRQAKLGRLRWLDQTGDENSAEPVFSTEGAVDSSEEENPCATVSLSSTGETEVGEEKVCSESQRETKVKSCPSSAGSPCKREDKPRTEPRLKTAAEIQPSRSPQLEEDGEKLPREVPSSAPQSQSDEPRRKCYIPMSIDDVIRHMDRIEPGKNYYFRQKDSRGGCSGTRGKLRKFARKNPHHPAIRHWICSGRWEPPNEESLNALIDFLKSMLR